MKRLLPVAILALLTAFTFAAAPAAPRDDSAAEKLGWRLATKGYTFMDLTLFETIDISRALGLKYLEVNPTQKLSPEHPVKSDQTLPPELRAELKQKLAEAGVQAVALGVVPLTADEAKDRAVFEYAKDLGIQTLVSEPPAAAFDLLDKLTEEYGIRVAIHNHPAPSPYAFPETELKVFAAHRPRIGSCADVGHWTRSGLSAVESLHQLEGHIVQLHFKDVGPGKKDVPWGTGGTDVKGMLEELHRQKFQGVFSMEYEGVSRDRRLDELKQSIAYFDEQARRIAESAGH